MDAIRTTEAVKAYNQPLVAMAAVLDASKVIIEQEKINTLSGHCGDAKYKPLAIIRPNSTKEVQEIVKIASSYNLPVHPISRGCNWGYGSGQPCSPDTLLIDLSEMNRIIEYNKELAYVVIEPGVTQQQLTDYLNSHGGVHRVDVTGSSPFASVLGSALERGFGLSLYADRSANMCNLQVVLSDGTVVNSGFGRFNESKAQNLYRWGIGPGIDPLFNQSNYGIVTKATVWLMPAPEYGGTVSIRFKTDRDFAQALPGLRDLRLRGVLRSGVHVANELRVLSTFERLSDLKSTLSDGDTLSDRDLERIRTNSKLGAWNVIAGLWGTKRQVKAELAAIRSTLKNYRVNFISENAVQFFAKYPTLTGMILGDKFVKSLPLFGLLQGRPSELPLGGTYWRKQKAAPSRNLDPVRDACGVLWCSPVIPSTTADVSQLIATTRAVMHAFKLETNVAVTLFSERACCGTVGILFDKENLDQTRRAHEAHAVLMREYLAHGYYPYRLGVELDCLPKDLLSAGNDGFFDIQHRIKAVLDPAGIISPGKYGIV